MIRKLSAAIAIFLIFSASEAYMPAQPSATFEPKTIQNAREMMYLYPDDASIVLPELSYQEQLEIFDLITQKDRTYLTIQRDISVNNSNWKLLGTKENFNIWHLHIKSPAAVGMQVLFSEATLTSQFKVKVYSGQNAVTSHIGEYPDIRSQNKEEFWSTSVPGNTIVIEVWVAQDSSLQPSTFPFIIKKINHYFRKRSDDLPALRDFSLESQAQQPSCSVQNNECIPDDIGAYRAISFIEYTEPNGRTFSCTGSFLNSSGSSELYLLTAFHCIYPGSSQEMRKGSIINAQVITSQSVCATDDDKLVGNDVRFIAGNDRGDWALLWVNSNSVQRADGRRLPSRTNSPVLLGYNSDSLSVGSTLETLHHGNSNRQNYAQAEVTGRRYAVNSITSNSEGNVLFLNCRSDVCTHYSINALRGGLAEGASGASFWGPRYLVRGVLSTASENACEGSISRFDKIYEDGRVQCALTDGNLYYPDNTSSCDDSSRPLYDTPRLARISPRLAQLSLSAGDLYPNFNSAITAYVATVDGDTTQLELNLRAAADRQKITVNGRAVAANAMIRLSSEAVQMITITVRTADDSEKHTYTIKIIRLSEQSFEPVGTWQIIAYEHVDIQCLGLTADDLFGPVGSEYDIVQTSSGRFNLINNSDSSIIYNETRRQPPNRYTFRYTDSSTEFGFTETDTITVILNSDEQATVVGFGNARATDLPDFTCNTSYIIQVQRPRSSIALKDLSLSTEQPTPSLQLTPSFDSTIKQYTATVDSDIGTFIVTPVANHDGQEIIINGTAASSGSGARVPLNVGDNTINIVVTSADGRATASYTITVTRQMPYLTALTLSTGQVNPNFNSRTMQYTAIVDSDVAQIRLNPTSNGNRNTIAITANDNPITNNTVPLNVGNNIITLSVATPDGQAITSYTITVTRQKPCLTALSLSVGTIMPHFAGQQCQDATLNYRATVGNGVREVNVMITADSDLHTITINEQNTNTAVRLEVGDNPTTITVATADDTGMQNYRLTIRRLSTATLSDLIVAAQTPTTTQQLTLKPDFNPTNLNYFISVDHTLNNILVTPTADAGRTIAVRYTPQSGSSINNQPIASGEALPITLTDSINTIYIDVVDRDPSAMEQYILKVNFGILVRTRVFLEGPLR